MVWSLGHFTESYLALARLILHSEYVVEIYIAVYVSKANHMKKNKRTTEKILWINSKTKWKMKKFNWIQQAAC